MSGETQPLYAGTFERSMDAKKRVAVPAMWLQRKEGEEFFAVPHPSQKFLMVMPPTELDRWEQKFDQLTTLSPAQRRDAIRRFYASAHKVTTDSQGRILLPEEQCTLTGLKSAIIAVGGKSRFEIWDKDRYEADSATTMDAYLKAAEDIGL